MTQPDGQNGGSPSRNVTGPDEGGQPGGDRLPDAGHEVVLVLNDRLDALERALGTVRRRQMTLKVFSLSRREDAVVLVFRGDPGTPLPDRWLAELGTLVDVRQMRVARIPASQ